MATSAKYKTLTEIGAASSYDPGKLSSATVESMVSHINLLKRNDVPITKAALTADPVRLLDSLVTSKGKRLTPLYKLQIAATLRRMYPNDFSIDTRKYNAARKSATTRVSSQPFMQAIRKIIDAASVVVKQAYVETEIEDLATYDTSLVVLLSSCTSMRVSELYQLKTTDIETIRRNEPVVVHSKGALAGRRRVISPNDLLLAVLVAVQEQRVKAERAATNSLAMNRSPRYKANRLNGGFILLTSISHMRRKLKEIAATFGVHLRTGEMDESDGHTLGFNAFRKYITTMLVDGGGHTVARVINNHTNLNTTLSNYHILSAETAEATFDRIDGMMAVENQSDTSSRVPPDSGSEKAADEYVFPPTPVTPGGGGGSGGHDSF